METKGIDDFTEQTHIPERLVAGEIKTFRDPVFELAKAFNKSIIFLVILACITITTLFLYFNEVKHNRNSEKVVAVLFNEKGTYVGKTEATSGSDVKLNEENIEYFLTVDFLTRLRSVPSDRIFYQRQLENTYTYMTQATKTKIEKFIQEQTTTSEVLQSQDKTISVTINSFAKFPNGDNVYKVRWTETIYRANMVEGESNYEALLTITRRKLTGKAAKLNPFGIIIEDISLTKESR